jgi:hypothetical protein
MEVILAALLATFSGVSEQPASHKLLLQRK